MLPHHRREEFVGADVADDAEGIDVEVEDIADETEDVTEE